MADSLMTVLMLGDVVGQAGMRAVFFGLKTLIKEYEPDFIVCNGENAADGFGLLPEQAQQLWKAGVHVITGGNHTWEKKELYPVLNTPNILRPANYSKTLPGTGYLVYPGTPPIAVINLQGRTRLVNLDDPFVLAQELVKKASKETPVILVDFHAEATDEKEAMAMALDGLVSVVAGTHTHIQTADERAFPKGTWLISDLGMCGVTSGVIGSSAEASVKRMLTGLPVKGEMPEGETEIQGICLKIDKKTGKVAQLTRIRSRVL